MIVLGALVAMIGVYAGSYLALSSEYPDPASAANMRGFSRRWQVPLFVPAAAIEARIRGIDIELGVETETAETIDFEPVYRISL